MGDVCCKGFLKEMGQSGAITKDVVVIGAGVVGLAIAIELAESGRQVTTSTGETVTVGPKATFGTVSSGGLY